MNQPIARRELTAESLDGSRCKITIHIDAPYLLPDTSWHCFASIDGLPGRPLDAHGGDSLQALLFGIRNVRARLDRFVADGGKLYFAGDETDGPVPVAELFGDGA